MYKCMVCFKIVKKEKRKKEEKVILFFNTQSTMTVMLYLKIENENGRACV